MLELLKHRRSIRTFTDEPVSQENIDSLLKAALLAPSSMGKKPVECIVVRNKETIARLKNLQKARHHTSRNRPSRHCRDRRRPEIRRMGGGRLHRIHPHPA